MAAPFLPGVRVMLFGEGGGPGSIMALRQG
jgi:hypothetical protein